MSEEIIKLIVEKEFGEDIKSIESPSQGADGFVAIVSSKSHKDIVIKLSTQAYRDKVVISDILQNQHRLVPKMICFGELETGEKYIITERAQGTLAREIPFAEKPKYFPSLMKSVKDFHSFKSDYAGLVDRAAIEKSSLKDFLIRKYTGRFDWFNWEEISQRPGVDQLVLNKSLEFIIKRINESELFPDKFSLTHTDLNLGNFFVDTKTFEVTSIIDWSEAIYADELYDFARVRMDIWHSLDKQQEEAWLSHLGLDIEQAELEQIYFNCHIIDYINWFSEKADFRRLKMHFDYLEALTAASSVVYL